MTRTQVITLRHMIDSFDEAYGRFLRTRGMFDSPVVKVGFFAAMHQIVTDDPNPNEELQQEVLDYLNNVAKESMDNCFEEIELLFIDVAQGRIAAANPVLA